MGAECWGNRGFTALSSRRKERSPFRECGFGEEVLAAEFAEEGGGGVVTAEGDDGSVLPMTVLLVPSAVWRVALILMDVVYPFSVPEGLAENQNLSRMFQQRFERPECSHTGTVFPCRTVGSVQMVFIWQNCLALDCRLKFRAAVVIERAAFGR